MLEITEDAMEVLKRAHGAAVRVNPEAKIRLALKGDELETSFVDGAEQDDEVHPLEEMTLYVARDVGDAILDTSEEHDRLILKRAEP